MRSRDLVVGVDIGTTSVTAIIISKDAEILYVQSLPHDVISKRPGFAEEDPEGWWINLKQLFTDISRKIEKHRIAVIGVSGMVPTLILIDDRGKPLYNSIQQNDSRAVEEIEQFKTEINEDRMFRLSGNTINQQVIFPKFRWLRRHYPRLVEKTCHIMGSYNYCTYKICGCPTLDLNWALESGLWLIREKKWNTELLDQAQISIDLLPRVFSPEEMVGTTSREFELQTGFPSGIPVIAGSADHVASALSCGLQQEGDLLLKIGGAGDILMSVDSIRLDRRLFIDYHDIKGKYLINGCMASSGAIVKWFMNQFHQNDYNILTSEAAKISPGSDGLVLLPYFLGEKTPIFDVNARGVFFGLSLYHTKYHMFRAILEAVAYGFMHHIEVIKELGYSVGKLYISNGGAKSDLWKRILVDAVGYDGIYIPNHPGSCIGVAFLAAQAAQVTKDWDVLRRYVKKGIKVTYSKANHEKYQKYFDIYKRLYLSLKSLFPLVREIEQ